MAYIDVSDAPLVVNVVYFSRITNFADYALTTTPLLPLLPYVPSGPGAPTPAQIAQLEPYLTNSLETQFGSLWDNMRTQEEAKAVSVFGQQAAASGIGATNIVASFPSSSSGSVLAEIINAVPASANNPAQPAILNLSYQLPGCDVSFDTGSITAEWDISFDAAIVVSTPVPLLPLTLTPTANLVTSNANLNADNIWATAESIVDLIVTSITQGLSASQRADAAVDGTQTLTGLGAFTTMLTSMNGAGATLVPLGFTQCGFSVALYPTGSVIPAKALTLTITHPLDPGPAVQNANNPQSSHQLFTPPTLSASVAQAQPGATITVVGKNFPVESMDQLAVQWLNTSSGAPTDSQIKYQIAGQNTAVPLEVALPVSPPASPWPTCFTDTRLLG